MPKTAILYSMYADMMVILVAACILEKEQKQNESAMENIMTAVEHEIHIYFNSPLQTGPDAIQGLFVCDRETTIPAHIRNSCRLERKAIRLTITI